MAIITFCSEDKKETGQTMSMVAIASCMAIEHNYKTLIVSTEFDDMSLENVFWEQEKTGKFRKIINSTKDLEIDNGIEGLLKVIASNRISNEIVKNYSRTVLRGDRLDVLLPLKTRQYDEYLEDIKEYTKILLIANRYYDMVFVDLSNKMSENVRNDIKNLSDIVVLNFTQKMQNIKQIEFLRESNEVYRKSKTMLLLGRYDGFSKYNIKNTTRYLKEKKMINVIPYNTLFFEACAEGNLIDFLLKIRNITDESDRNFNFLNEVNKINKNIIYKLQELQMKM